jgi:hypothetical protein
MDDPLLVCRGQASGDLHAVLDSLVGGERAAPEALPQGLPLEQLGDDVGPTVVRADVVNGEDVGVVEGPGGARFLLEAAQAMGPRDLIRQHLDRHPAPQARVTGTVDVPHAPDAEQADEIRRELEAGVRGPEGPRIQAPMALHVDAASMAESQGPMSTPVQWLRFVAPASLLVSSDASERGFELEAYFSTATARRFMPSCCIIPSASVSCRCSMTLPSSNRIIEITLSSIPFPVAGIPPKSP